MSLADDDRMIELHFFLELFLVTYDHKLLYDEKIF
jgi:hypothetical protein